MFSGLTKASVMQLPRWRDCPRRFFVLSSHQQRKKKASGWEKELEALYGPKLSKKQVTKVLEASKQKFIEDTTSRIEYEPPADCTTQTRTVITKSKQDPLNESLETDPAVPPVRSNDFNDLLDKLLMFPMFEPTSDSCMKVEEFSDLPHKDIIAGPMRGYVPSVSKIINETMSPEARYFLERWEKEMIEKLGMEGFQKYKKDTFARGHKLHECIEQHLLGTPLSDLDITPNIEQFWKSIEGYMGDFNDVKFLEQKVTHPYLGYTGYFDCVARYKDTLCLIDWKTSKKQKPNIKWTYDNPLQLAAYLGAYNFDPKYKGLEKVENALLVIAYEDGERAHAHSLSRLQCQQYWTQWLQRLRAYWNLKAE